jgi:hypothetical protein
LDDGRELWRNRRLLHKTPEVQSINAEKNVIDKEVSNRSKRIPGRYKDFKM